MACAAVFACVYKVMTVFCFGSSNFCAQREFLGFGFVKWD